MNFKIFLMMFIFLISVTLVVGGQTNSEYSFNMFTQPTFNNNTAFVNASEFWDTVSLGALNDANTTQFSSSGGTLNWRESFGEGLFLSLDGSNANQLIDIQGESLMTTGDLIIDSDTGALILGADQDSTILANGLHIQVVPTGFFWIDGGEFDSVDWSSSTNPLATVLTKKSTDNNKNVFGAWIASQYEISSDSDKSVYGANIFAYTSGSSAGDLTRTAFPGGLVANFLEVRHKSDATVAEANGLVLRGQVSGTGVITEHRALRIYNPSVSGGGAMTNAIGIWIDDLSAGTNNYGIVLDGDGSGADIILGDLQETRVYQIGETLFINNSAGNVQLGDGTLQKNMTLTSPDGTEYNCGVSNGGGFSCT